MTFAERLKQLRESRGWSQGHLAQAAGLTRDGVAHLEQGRRKPAWETVQALAKALGVSCEAFADDAASAAPAPQPPAPTDEPKKPRKKKE
jgi:transcriptional regulator with XRE-family HTH domain